MDGKKGDRTISDGQNRNKCKPKPDLRRQHGQGESGWSRGNERIGETRLWDLRFIKSTHTHNAHTHGGEVELPRQMFAIDFPLLSTRLEREEDKKEGEEEGDQSEKDRKPSFQKD